MSDKERIARVHARTLACHSFEKGRGQGFDKGWEAGVAWAQEEIAKRMEHHAEALGDEFKWSYLLAMAQAKGIRDGTWKLCARRRLL